MADGGVGCAMNLSGGRWWLMACSERERARHGGAALADSDDQAKEYGQQAA